MTAESVARETSEEPIRALLVAGTNQRLGEMTSVLEREYDVRTSVVAADEGETDAFDGLAAADCVVAGPSLGGSGALWALETVREKRPEMPVTLFYEDETTAATALEAGADHCIRYDGDRPAAQAAHVAVLLRRERQRRAATRALREESTFVRGALDALDDVFFLFNLDGEFLLWNDALTEVTGYADEVIEGMVPTDFVADADREGVAEAIQRAVVEGRAKAEAEIVTESGEHVPYEFTGALLTDESGAALGVCGIGRDVTDRKRRERALSHHADRLEVLNRVNEVIRDVNQALVRVSTSEEIESAVCDHLTDEGAYRTAWIAEPRAGGVERRAWAGVDGPPDRPDIDEGTIEAAAEAGELRVVIAAATDSDLERTTAGDESVAAVPLVYHDTTYGVLCVSSPRSEAFEGTEHDVLAELGETVASALSAAEQRRALVSDSVVELEFALRDRGVFTVDLTARTGCRVTLDGIVERSDGTLVEFVTISGTDPETVLELAADREDIEATLVSHHGEDCAFQLVSEMSSTVSLADMGGVIREAAAEDGEGRLVFELPREADVRTLIEAFADQYDDAELIAQREHERTTTRGVEFRAALDDALTRRQHEVLKTAYLSGFFEWPRANNGDTIAASLGVSAPTFHEHIRTGQRKLLDAFFESAAATDA